MCEMFCIMCLLNINGAYFNFHDLKKSTGLILKKFNN